MTHELKTWPEYFNPILTGSKTFEVRKDDRCYKVGDTLHLKEYNLGGAGMSEHDLTGFYTGRELKVTITFILHGPAFGIHEGHCVMGFSLQKELPTTALTIPEAEVDAEEILEEECLSLPAWTNNRKAAVLRALRRCSDLRLAKAMEEKENEMLGFTEWAISVIKEYQRGGTYTVNPPLDCSKTFTINELYQLFLADKKKGDKK